MLKIGNFQIPYPEAYLIAVNLLSFIFHSINAGIKKKRDSETYPMNALVILLSVIGGAPGILLSILFFDRKSNKGNMMLRVSSFCFLIIYAVAFLVYKGMITEEHRFSFWKIFMQHKYLLYYICGINAVALIAYGIDKLKAIKESSRISIVFLLLLAAIGGSVGAFLGMIIFHHKTRKSYFAFGVPLIFLTQLAVLIYLINNPWTPALYV